MSSSTQRNWLNVPDNRNLAERLSPMDAEFSPTLLKGTTASITTLDSTQVIAAQGAGVKIYVTDIMVTCGHATVGTYVKILDGATIIWEGYAAAAGGGFAISLKTPLVGTANTDINAQCVTDASDVIVSIAGYQGY